MASGISISILPTEVMVEIFSLVKNPYDLGRLEQVCILWRRILNENSQIWKIHLLRINPNFSQVELEEPKKKLISRIAPSGFWASLTLFRDIFEEISLRNAFFNGPV